MKKMNKKGVMGLQQVPQIALVFVLIAMFFVIGLVILASLQSNTTVSSNAAANTAVTNSITALSEIPNNWLLLIAVVVAASVVIGIVISSLGGAANEGR